MESRRLMAAGTGLRADYFNDADLAALAVSRSDPVVNFAWGAGAPHETIDPDTFSARWTGTVTPRFTDAYTFHAQTDDGVRLWVNGQKLIDDWSDHDAVTERRGTIALRAGRAYDLVLEYYDNAGDATARLLWSGPRQPKEIIPASQLSPSDRGSIRTEQWDDVAGAAVADLTADPRYPGSPSAVSSAREFGLPLNTMQRFGQRFRGYVHAPQTGAYTFWVSGDDTAELYLGNSRDPDGRRLVASVPAPTGEFDFSNYLQWDKYPQQRSAPVRLVAGQAYYVELLHKQENEGNHVAVGWTLPDGRFEGPIPGHELSPLLPEVRLYVEESTAQERNSAPATFTVVRQGAGTADALAVRYTLSGTATSGADYAITPASSLDGVVWIPRGQTSATFSVTPLNDALIEGAERVTVTLSPVGDYTFGPESSTRGTVTILDDDRSVPGTDVIPPNAAPSAFSYFGSAGTRTILSNIQGMPFTQANRVVTHLRPANVWDMQLQVRNTAPISQGDTLELTFWARNGDANKPSASFQVVFEKAATPYTKSLLANGTVGGSAWQQFSYAFGAAEAYDATTNRGQLGFQLGFDPQTIDVAGVVLKNYGRSVRPEDLGGAGQTYQGRQGTGAGGAWRAGADARIEQHRKGGLAVTVRDAAGNPLPGAAVSVRMAEHAFGFGSAVAGDLINSTTSPDAPRYRQLIKELFNKVVLENDLKWPSWQNNPSVAINAINWLFANGVDDVRGHNLVWPSWQYVPASPGSTYKAINYRADPNKPDSQEEYEAHVTADGADAARAWLRQRVLSHITQEAAHPSLKGRLGDWDVVNEPYTNHQLQDVLGGEAELVSWFNAANAADPAARLFLNDYPSLAGGAHLDAYFATIRRLLDQGAPIEGIGFQGHFGSGTPAIETMRAQLERFAAAFPDQAFQITEFDQESGDEQLQADFLRDFMTLSFSEPALDAFVMWGFWQGRHWRPAAALWRSDWSIKPNGQQWLDLVFGDWWTDVYGTTAPDGRYAARAFAGAYDVTASFGGATRTVRATVTAGADGALEVTLPVEPTSVAGRGVFYDGSAYGTAPAPDKQALLPGQTPTFANVTSYTRGINGITIDLANLPAGSTPEAADFSFRVGDPARPLSWSPLDVVPAVTVQRGGAGGAGGPARVSLSLPGARVTNRWLEVTVAANARTGLVAPDVFSFGNLVGDTGDSDARPFRVNALDLAAVRRALGADSTLAGRFDFNRDGRVNALDLAAVRSNLGRLLGEG